MDAVADEDAVDDTDFLGWALTQRSVKSPWRYTTGGVAGGEAGGLGPTGGVAGGAAERGSPLGRIPPLGGSPLLLIAPI